MLNIKFIFNNKIFYLILRIFGIVIHFINYLLFIIVNTIEYSFVNLIGSHIFSLFCDIYTYMSFKDMKNNSNLIKSVNFVGLFLLHSFSIYLYSLSQHLSFKDSYLLQIISQQLNIIYSYFDNFSNFFLKKFIFRCGTDFYKYYLYVLYNHKSVLKDKPQFTALLEDIMFFTCEQAPQCIINKILSPILNFYYEITNLYSQILNLNLFMSIIRILLFNYNLFKIIKINFISKKETTDLQQQVYLDAHKTYLNSENYINTSEDYFINMDEGLLRNFFNKLDHNLNLNFNKYTYHLNNNLLECRNYISNDLLKLHMVFNLSIYYLKTIERLKVQTLDISTNLRSLMPFFCKYAQIQKTIDILTESKSNNKDENSNYPNNYFNHVLKDIQRLLFDHNQNKQDNIKIINKIEIKDLCVTINQKDILKNINLEFNKSFIGLYAESGSGKSVLLRTILGLFPYSGSIKINDCIHDNRDLIDSQAILCMQFSLIHNNKSIWYQISFDEQLSDYHKKFIVSLSKIFNLFDIIDNLPSKFDTVLFRENVGLSGGQLKKLMLIKSVYLCCISNKILLCDEPTSGLSINEGNLIIQRLKSISNKFNFKVIIACHTGTYHDTIFDQINYLYKN